MSSFNCWKTYVYFIICYD